MQTLVSGAGSFVVSAERSSLQGPRGLWVLVGHPPQVPGPPHRGCTYLLHGVPASDGGPRDGELQAESLPPLPSLVSDEPVLLLHSQQGLLGSTGQEGSVCGDPPVPSLHVSHAVSSAARHIGGLLKPAHDLETPLRGSSKWPASRSAPRGPLPGRSPCPRGGDPGGDHGEGGRGRDPGGEAAVGGRQGQRPPLT